MAPEGRILKANFQKFSGGDTPEPICGRGYPIPIPHPSPVLYNVLLCARLKPPSAGTQTFVPIWCSKNNLLSSPLLGARSPWPQAPSHLLALPFLNSSFSPLSPLFPPSPSFRGRNPLIPLPLPLALPSLSLSFQGSEGFSTGKTFQTLMAAGEN